MKLRAALLLVAVAQYASAGEQAAQVFEDVSPSIYSVFARSDSGMMGGSAVVVRPGYAVTNLHVVKDATSVKLKHGAEEETAVVETSDAQHDLALLRVEGLTAPVANFGETANLRVGQTVYAVGSPRGLELSLSEGLVSSLRPMGDGSAIQTTAPISPGSSGGGLFDEHGRLLGITTAQMQNGQNLNFAIPVEWLRYVGIKPTPLPVLGGEPAHRSSSQAAAAAPAGAVPTAAAGPKTPVKEPRLYVTTAILVLIIVLAIPATKWLVAVMSSDALPDLPPPPPVVRPAAAVVDRMAPFRDLARAEAETGRRDATLWQQSLEQTGYDEVAAITAYAKLRGPVLYEAEMERRKNASRSRA